MKKNNLILLVCLLIILFISFYSYQHLNVKDKCIVADNVEQKVKDIDSNISKYSFTSKDIFDKSTEGGQQTNYTLNGKIMLIKQVFFGETGKSEVSYYLENGRVFYFQKINTEYVFPLSEDSSGKVKSTKIKEFYLDNNHNLCLWYLNKNLQINDLDTRDLVQYLISGL